MGFSPSGPVKANRGIRARVPAAGKVLEGDDQRTLSPLYYDDPVDDRRTDRRTDKTRNAAYSSVGPYLVPY